MGAICEYCHQDMTESDGCTLSHVKIHGKIYDRIKVGDKDDMFGDISRKNGYCHDCAANVGTYHHPFCECDVYPPNKGQFLMECDDTEEFLP